MTEAKRYIPSHAQTEIPEMRLQRMLELLPTRGARVLKAGTPIRIAHGMVWYRADEGHLLEEGRPVHPHTTIRETWNRLNISLEEARKLCEHWHWPMAPKEPL